MDGVFAGIVLFFLLVFSVLGAVFLFNDFRYYGDVYTQCQKQGFIQNQTTRITCKVEQ